MSKIQIDAGRSSATTHRLTQPSTTLNRRYVRRPSNIAVDEAAHAAALREQATETPPAAPSRLVNLGVHAADLEKAQAAAAEPVKPEIDESESVDNPIILTPNIVEFGRPREEDAAAIVRAEPKAEIPTASTITAAVNDDIVASEPQTVTDAPHIEEKPAEIDTATLAANIAADYAATSLDLSIKEYSNGHDAYAMTSPAGETIAEEQADAAAGIQPAEHPTMAINHGDSIEAIALATSNAIASIREATDPDQVSEQIASLKAFSDNIKARNMPEMRELSDTIDKFISIAMKSSKIKAENEQKAAIKVALSPKVTRAAAKVTKSSAKVMAINNRTKNRTSTRINPAHAATVSKANLVHSARNTTVTKPKPHRPDPQAAKDQAIESTLASVATMEERESTAKSKKTAMPHRKTGAKRFAIAFACAAACVAAVIGFVGSNMPDISVRVAAMQTGIQASYPSYVPRDYSLGGINSEDGKITMLFQGPDNSSFKLIEEKSSWDSSALLRNYVEPTWGEEYVTTHEQGITIYISNATSDAAWVNGGVLYKITSEGTPLTKKQVRSIVTSL